jgi:hypothetical protein
MQHHRAEKENPVPQTHTAMGDTRTAELPTLVHIPELPAPVKPQELGGTHIPWELGQVQD